jgi:transposase
MGAQEKGRTNEEIAQAMGLSVRQVQRLNGALKKKGPGGLAHGNRGRRASNAVPEGVESKIIRLYKEKYKGFNFTHYTEKLNDEEEIVIGISSVRRLLLSAGCTSPKKRRAPKHRSRRERKSHEGSMLQIDGSIHDWLEGRGPKLCLIGAIDDATGIVPGALFREREDSHGYFLLMREIVEEYGIPETIYRDRHSIFQIDSKDEQDVWERLTNKPALTQFGRLLDELGIRDIPANSPQAKGRVERLWGTFQDRLVSELRLANAYTIDEANAVLKKVIAEHNKRFAKEAKASGNVYRELNKTCDRDRLFCFKYRRTVAKDNAVRFADEIVDIPKGPGGRSYAGCRVELRHHFDNSLWLYYQGECIGKTQPDPTPPTRIRVRTSNGRYTEECPWADIESWQPKPKEEKAVQTTEPKERRPNKPAANHPWRRSWVTKSPNA